MKQKFPRAGLKKLFLLDFHFRMFSIFFIILLIPLLINIYLIAVTLVLNIATLLICWVRYSFINGCLKNGEIVIGKLTTILRQLRKSHYIEVEGLNKESMEGLYSFEVFYVFQGKEFKIKTPITYLRTMGEFRKDQEIEILVNSEKPKKYIVKNIWVPADYIAIS